MSSSSTLSYLCARINDLLTFQQAATEHIENLESQVFLLTQRLTATEDYITSKGLHFSPKPTGGNTISAPHPSIATPDTLPHLPKVVVSMPADETMDVKQSPDSIQDMFDLAITTELEKIQ